MADQQSGEGSNTAIVSGECSDSTVELNIKTLDSRVYSFQVDKNMPVPLFKEKIANETGVPAGQQRLIFRGKVLKDNHLLSDYQVENGHTLHLVMRQPVQSQVPSGTSSGETNGNNNHQATDANMGGSRNRVGQISHSVVLGTFNVGDQGEGIVPDITRVIGAVLNSIGVGNQAATNISGSTLPVTTPSNANSFSQGNQTQGTRGNINSQNQSDNQAQSAQPSLSQPFQSPTQFFSIPPGAHAVTIPSVNAPIPDSLHTISEFMNHMEQTMVQNGYRQRSSSDSSIQQPRMDLPSNAQGLHTPEALSIVLRQAERLLSDHAAAALSHIAGCLEQDSTSLDPIVRGQIQTESVQVGLAMQHLGALFLELGRTILTLRMGQTPVESAINAGPAVYISPSGPNPIMVQPFPLQTSSLFGDSVPPANPPAFAPAGIGNAPRNVNIHIHAGASLPPILSVAGTRGSSGDGTQGERRNGNSNGDASAPQGFHMRNIIATAVPSRPAGVVASFPGQPGPTPTFSVSQPSSDSSISSIVAEINSRVSSIVANMQGDNSASSGQDQSNVQNPPFTSGSHGAVNEHSSATMVPQEEHNSRLPAGMPQGEGHCGKDVDCVSGVKDYSKCSDEGPGSCSSGQINSTSGDGSGSALQSVARQERTEDTRAVPLGLGFGTLERRKQGREEKPMAKSGEGTTSSSKDENPQPSTQQILQALAARSSAMDRMNVNSPSSEQLLSGAGQVRDGRSMQGQSSVEGVDMTNVMSQVLQSPALNGILTGVSEQTGVGSPDVLRNMLQQFTQSPQMMNAVNQIAQQFEGQDVGNMFAGLGGQGGGIDLSRMFQQMMPIVSQAFGSSSTTPQTFSVLEPEPSRDQHSNQSSQRLAQRIEQLNSPQDVFHALVENSLQSTGDEIDSELLVEDLCSDGDLVNEYIELLQREIRDRHE